MPRENVFIEASGRNDMFKRSFTMKQLLSKAVIC